MTAFLESRTVQISEKTFNQLNDWIEDAKATGRNAAPGMDLLARVLALTNQGIAQEMSRGPLDPHRSGVRYAGRVFTAYAPGRGVYVSGPRGVYKEGRPAPTPQWEPTAWKIPVRRITSRYFLGWKVRRLARGRWMLYNFSREAYFIEFGINHVGTTRVITGRNGYRYLRNPRRVRRPIQKLSLMKTLRYAEQTDVYGKVWGAIFSPMALDRRTRSDTGAFMGGAIADAGGYFRYGP